MFSFKNHREQFNMQGAAQRVPMHTITAGEVRASTRHSITSHLVAALGRFGGMASSSVRLIAQQVTGGKP
jgi:hypothetical protein